MKHTPESIKELLGRNDKAVYRALKIIKEQNDFCFGGHSFGNSLCKQINEGKVLSVAQMNSARNLLQKYAQFLANVANEKEKGATKETLDQKPAAKEKPPVSSEIKVEEEILTPSVKRAYEAYRKEMEGKTTKKVAFDDIDF